MTSIDLLKAYREIIIELQQLLEQQSTPGVTERINHRRMRREAMADAVNQIIEQINHPRTYVVIKKYYQHGLTDEAIAREIHMSRARVNQIRNAYERTSTG
jgi:DNA-directed RNA polymerase specialized sigma subunit